MEGLPFASDHEFRSMCEAFHDAASTSGFDARFSDQVCAKESTYHLLMLCHEATLNYNRMANHT